MVSNLHVEEIKISAGTGKTTMKQNLHLTLSSEAISSSNGVIVTGVSDSKCVLDPS